MARVRTTISDIAEALGMSRNTVSKALTNSSQVTMKTRELVVAKARELNYRGAGFLPTSGPSKGALGSVVFVTRSFQATDLFWPQVVRGVEEIVSAAGYNFSIRMMRTEDDQSLSMAEYVRANKVSGIICTELYDQAFIQHLESANVPLVMIDTVWNAFDSDLNYDVVLMENLHSTKNLTSMLIRKGHTRIGFVGKIDHCRSFYERYLGFTMACAHHNLPSMDRFNLNPVIDDYSADWLVSQLSRLDELPSALICANDSVAIRVYQAARLLGLRVPDDLAVTGFDDVVEARFLEPQLTTVDIPKEALGKRAAEVLLWRILNPDRPFEITYVENTIKLRGSA